ncbi:MAG TPA: hypothetical protein VMW52_13305 [Phycisphaerae bacterium]|nr:hypothetical protein [Phycisphaerae bacterium]
MTRIGCTIRFVGAIPSGRRFAAVRTATHRAIAEAWVATYLPRHFAAGAAGRYGYSPRSPKTRRRKQAQGRPYLVEQGELERSARASAPYGIKAAPNYIRLSVDAPPYITQQRRPKQPDYPAEVFDVTSPEEKDLMRVGEAKAAELLTNNRETKTVQIG